MICVNTYVTANHFIGQKYLDCIIQRHKDTK